MIFKRVFILIIDSIFILFINRSDWGINILITLKIRTEMTFFYSYSMAFYQMKKKIWRKKYDYLIMS